MYGVTATFEGVRPPWRWIVGHTRENRGMPQAPHVYVDEAKTQHLLLTAASLPPERLAQARRALRSLLMPGQRRPHFHRESDRQRKKTLDGITGFTPALTVYDGGDHPRQRQREICLRALMADLAARDTRMLVLERDEKTLHLDEVVLAEQKRRLQCPQLRYEHMRAREEPLLAIPDAIAWCWQRGGPWKARVRELVTEVRV